MPKVRTQISCPQCRQPLMAEIEQVYDLSVDPAAKNRLLSGQSNVAQCKLCGFNGAISTPLVYHDPTKELLLTFVPGELGLPRDEQERVIGGLIKQVVDNLPPEKRKGYLFNPQAALTRQGLLERILQEDGITKEMIDEQQRRVNLIQRLVAISDDEALAIVAKEEDKQIDADFFSMLSQLIQMAAAQGDQQGAQLLGQLQQRLLPITTIGKELQERSREVQTVLELLRSAGKELTRDKLLELVMGAASDLQVEAFVGFARPGMDYQFFQLLSDKIEQAKGEEKARLTGLREKLLEYSGKLDEELQERLNLARRNVDSLLKTEDLEQAIAQNLPAIDDFFLQALTQTIDEADKAKDEPRVKQLEHMLELVQSMLQAASMGPEGVLLEALLEAEDAEARKKVMEENAEQITPEFIEAITGLMMQMSNSEDEEAKALVEKVRIVYREALRFSMKAQMAK